MLYKNQDWSDYLIKGVLALIVIGLVGAVIAIGVASYEDHLDTDGTPMIEGVGTVVLRTHIPARWQPVIVGRTTSGYWVPDSYLIRVEYDGWIGSRRVSATYYDSVTIGQRINICYQVGRSGRHYLRCVH